MPYPKRSANDLGSARPELEDRVKAMEDRIGDLHRGRVTPTDREIELESELAQLREAVDDLAAQNLDLHNQLNKVVSVCERILGGSDPVELGLQPKGGFRFAATRIGNTAKRVVQRTVVAARQMAGKRPSHSDDVVDLVVEVDESSVVRTAPVIALIVPTTEDPEKVDLPGSFLQQTDPDLRVVVWNEQAKTAVIRSARQDDEQVTAPDRRALASAIGADYAVEVPHPLSAIHPTLIERCRWTLASESLPLVVTDAGGDNGFDVVVRRVNDWVGVPDDLPDRAVTLTKSVGGSRWDQPDLVRRSSLVRSEGRCYLPVSGTKGRLTHRVALLDGVVAGLAAEEGRRLLLVITEPGDEGLSMWLARVLASDYQLTVLMTDGPDNSPLARGLVEVTPRVYPVGSFLEPVVWPSVAADIARAHGASAVLRIGDPLEVEMDPGATPIIDIPLDAAQADRTADLVLALGAQIADAARRLQLRTVDLVPGPIPSGRIPQTGSLSGIREAYGVAEDIRVVLTVCGLEPAHRPEDVAAVARRMRHRTDVLFLLVGRGSLAGSVSDLAEYFELRNFAMSPPGHLLSELVAVSDCVLSTAEADPWPRTIGAALALGRSVVATEVDGVRELAAAADSDRCVLCPPGDVDALTKAVEDALDNKRRPRITKKAWKQAQRRNEQAARVVLGAIGRLSETS